MDKALADRIEANRSEYERLLKDDNYSDVRFNSRTGAMSAIHREHNFDKTIGIFGIERGEYERISLEVLYDFGHRVVFESEKPDNTLKQRRFEGFLDEKRFEIKSIEGTGKRNVEYKIYEASGQDAETVVLYYHDASVFLKQRIDDGYKAYMRNSKSKKVSALYYIVDNKLHKIYL
jgi:hypothetical protein